MGLGKGLGCGCGFGSLAGKGGEGGADGEERGGCGGTLAEFEELGVLREAGGAGQLDEEDAGNLRGG